MSFTVEAGIRIALTCARRCKSLYYINRFLTRLEKEVVMKKIMVQLFVAGMLVATYALPVLAFGGGGPG